VRGNLVRRVWEHSPATYAPARYRRACAYEAFIPFQVSDLAVQLPGDLAGVVSDAEQAIANLNQHAGPELMPLARLLLRTESIASSKVEGMQVDARTLARAEANQNAGRPIGREAAEILANVDAMQLAIERASLAATITTKDIVDIHRVLLARAPNAHIAGQIRVGQNWIGGNDYNPCGADFVPPPPDQVQRLLTDLCAFFGDEALPPLVQAAIAHAQFETIHPFDDGNGRTGRALVQVILRRRNLAPAFVPPISVMLARNKESYIKGLTLFRADDVAEWLRVFAVAATGASSLAIRYTIKVRDLQQTWRQQLRQASDPRSDAAAWGIIDILPAHPIISVPVAAAATKRSIPAVTNGIAELEGAGVLKKVGESQRNRAWEPQGLLELIVGLESGVE
jgi:Fic family protein